MQMAYVHTPVMYVLNRYYEAGWSASDYTYRHVAAARRNTFRVWAGA
jgi:hypothetical protein